MPSLATNHAADTALRALAAQIVEQGWLNFLYPLPPGRIRLRAREVAVALGYKSEESVYAELSRADTWLETEQATSAELKRTEVWITARSVMLTLARRAMQGTLIPHARGGKAMPPLFMERVMGLLDHLDRAQLAAVEARVTALRRGGR